MFLVLSHLAEPSAKDESTKYFPFRHVSICEKSQGGHIFHLSTRGRPLKGRNILGCSGAISLHLHFLVLFGINRFQINETGFETGFQSKVLKNPGPSGLNRFQILENWF